MSVTPLPGGCLRPFNDTGALVYRQEIHLNIKFIKRINKILKGGSKWSFSQRAKQENLEARCGHHLCFMQRHSDGDALPRS